MSIMIREVAGVCYFVEEIIVYEINLSLFQKIFAVIVFWGVIHVQTLAS